MKKMMLAFVAFTIFGAISYGQCDKNVIFTSSKTEYLDSNLTLQRSVDEKTVIEISKTGVTITPGTNKMSGTIKSSSCKWTVPFKVGKSVIKAPIKDPSGDVKNVTLTFEGKDGKVTLLVEIEDDANKKIRVVADSFEEAK
ncbi:MAG: hypothetical protein ABUT20_02970 [Bacteroidota bacterium]